MPTYLIVGASRGIGGATAAHLAQQGADILAVSRSPAPVGRWIQADIGTVSGIETVLQAAKAQPLDGLLFLGGVWEQGAFTPDYRFLDSPMEETLHMIAVNLTAPILLAQGLAQALSQAPAPRIVLMGSMSGLANTATKEVANTATKFGLQGAAEALNLSLRPLGIATTVINPDNVATPEVEADIAQGLAGDQIPIPLADLTGTIDYVLGLSPHAVPSVINLCQTKPDQG
ncbi:MAG: SDR family NAD(P)-dependent oxidoreductase [Rhodospirillaceae bacterium]